LLKQEIQDLRTHPVKAKQGPTASAGTPGKDDEYEIAKRNYLVSEMTKVYEIRASIYGIQFLKKVLLMHKIKRDNSKEKVRSKNSRV